MTDLGNMQVTYTADISQLGSAVGKAKADMSSVADAAQSSGGGIASGFARGIGGIVDFGAKIGQTVIGMQGLASGAMGLASALLGPAATAETTQLSFETLLHSTSAAKKEMQDLNTFAAGTPMQTQWVDNAAAKILAFGGTTADVKPEITAIGDALSGLGKLSETSLNSIVDVFGKISAQGKITGGDMMQLSTWGIPAWQALSTSMHKSIPELQDMVSKGLIPANVALPALEKGMENTFGGGMAKQANTFTGLISTLQSNFQILMATIGGPALKLAEGGLQQIGAVLASPAFQTFATNVGQNIADSFTKVGSAFKYVGNVLRTVPLGDFKDAWQAVSGVAGDIARKFDAIFKSLNPLKGAIGDFDPLAETIQKLAKGGLNILSGLMWDVSTALMAIDKALQTGKGPLNIFSGAMSEMNREMKDVGAAAQQVGQWFMKSVVPAIMQALPGFMSLGKTIVTTVIPAIFQIRGVMLDVIEHGFKVFGPIIEKIIPPLIVLSGQIANGVGAALKFLMPYIVQAAKAIGQFASEIMDRVAPIITQWFARVSASVTQFAAWWSQNWSWISQVLMGVWNIIAGTVKVAWSLVSGIIKIGLDILSGNWKAVWTDLKAMLAGVWAGIQQVIGGSVQAVIGLLRGAWAAVVAATSSAFQTVLGKAHDVWNSITGVFAGAWGMISGPLNSLWSNISGWFTGLVGNASSWGSNIIQGFIDGINGMIGNVAGAAANIAQTIKDHLGFASPSKKGPGTTAHLWAPALISMFASDITSTSPKVQAAAEKMVASIQTALMKNKIQIDSAHLTGNTAQIKSLTAVKKSMDLQLADYKKLLMKDNIGFSTKNINHEILFGTAAKKPAAKKTSTAASKAKAAASHVTALAGTTISNNGVTDIMGKVNGTTGRLNVTMGNVNGTMGRLNTDLNKLMGAMAKQYAAEYPIKPAGKNTAMPGGANSSSQDSGTHTTIVQFDLTEIARVVQQRTDQLVRLKLGSKARLAV